MAKYMIEAPHTDADCLEALDEIHAKDPNFLEKFHWGCMSGVHNGWAIVEAESESEVLDMIPPSRRDKSRVTKVNKISPEQLAAAHQKK
jgi:hypothetical protein